MSDIRRLQVLLAATFVMCGAPGLAHGQSISPNISDYVSNKLDDFTATMHIEHHNDAACAKINKDFAVIYKLRGDVKLSYKEENMMRLDAHLGSARAVMIVAGTKQYVAIPGIGLRTTRDLGNSPGKRKTLLDVGLMSAGYLAYTDAKFLGARPVHGVMCACFEVKYRDQHLDTSHRNIWIDPKTRVVVKREEYSQVGKLVATYYYKNATQVSPGIWFPSEIEVINNEGEEAGETSYKDVAVNKGLDDRTFKM